jgi:hypothetical protein
MANLFTREKDLEAEYLARRRQHGSKTDQTFMQEGKIELEAEYLARRWQHGSQTDQTYIQDVKKEIKAEYLA